MQMPTSGYENELIVIISTEFVAEELPVWGTPSLQFPIQCRVHRTAISMSRRCIAFSLTRHLIYRKVRDADRHYAIRPSPAFLLREFAVGDPLDGLTTAKRVYFISNFQFLHETIA
jgi:hypothetical protein